MTVKQPTKKPAASKRPQQATATALEGSRRINVLVLLFTILCVAFTASAGWRYA
jgi:hypothetical protein